MSQVYQKSKNQRRGGIILHQDPSSHCLSPRYRMEGLSIAAIHVTIMNNQQ